ncbi:hypothetical protein EDB81DRAFT_387224 [Dactylonectria macrodidyma]|uniref:Uncharacterized protein n=1 Tax=Dactylonectria macrodidyma TaxID=307937 RepID=A0A9P9F8Y0_9HYPO|nr:hypothetical protein EDB81DRAFT_387224 [Dactylonectria macrodidyma]
MMDLCKFSSTVFLISCVYCSNPPRVVQGFVFWEDTYRPEEIILIRGKCQGPIIAQINGHSRNQISCIVFELAWHDSRRLLSATLAGL